MSESENEAETKRMTDVGELDEILELKGHRFLERD